MNPAHIVCGGVRCVTPPHLEGVSRTHPRESAFSLTRVWDTLAEDTNGPHPCVLFNPAGKEDTGMRSICVFLRQIAVMR